MKNNSNNNDHLFSEKMPPKLYKQILSLANTELKSVRSQKKTWWSEWGLNAGLAAASLALVLFIYSNQNVQVMTADLAATIDLMETIDEIEEFEMLADLELIENLEIIELIEEST